MNTLKSVYTIDGDYHFMVDSEDFDKVSKFEWRASFPPNGDHKRNSPVFQAYASVNGVNKTITPGQIIMNNFNGRRVYRENKDLPCNFSKSNLKVSKQHKEVLHTEENEKEDKPFVFNFDKSEKNELFNLLLKAINDSSKIERIEFNLDQNIANIYFK